MPLPGTKVVPAEWSRHHQPTASGGMNARCVITDPARTTPGEWDDETGTYGPPTPHLVLPAHPDGGDGWPCRVQADRRVEPTEQAGQLSTMRSYLVQLDDPDLATVPDIERGYLVHVTQAENDPRLEGEQLRVADVQHGSERFTRDLIVEHNQQARPAD